MYKFKHKPYDFQFDCWNKSKGLKHYALLMEMGTGKTKVLIDTAAYMYDQGWINALVVFGKKGFYSNWMDEIDIHMPEHIKHVKALWKSSARASDKKEIAKLFVPQPLTMKAFIVNIEAVAFKKCKDVVEKFLLENKCLMAIDESTIIKNPEASRTKTTIKLGRLAEARRILTGSSVDNRPLDIYSQYDFLKPGLIGYTSYYSFRSEYAFLQDMKRQDPRRTSGERKFKIVVGYRNLDRLKKHIAKSAFIIRKDDCLDLPAKIYQTYDVELTPEQIQHYTALKKKSMTEIADSITTVKIALTKMLRLHQLVCGHLTDDDGEMHDIPHNRIAALDDVIEGTDDKIIIWANYIADIKCIVRHLAEVHGKDSVVDYYGGTSQENRDRAKRILKRGADSEGVRFLVGNPQTAGYSLTLTAVTTVIYYSNSFDGEHRRQSEDRAHRIGQTEKVNYVDLVARGTIDEKVIKTLRDKKSLADIVTPSNWKEMLQ